jgi:hypothetical protein
MESIISNVFENNTSNSSSLFAESDFIHLAWLAVSQHLIATVVVLILTYTALVFLFLNKVYDFRSGDWEGIFSKKKSI